MSLGVIPRIIEMAVHRTVPYCIVPYGTVPKWITIRCARKNYTGTRVPVRYGIHGVLEVWYGKKPYRGHPAGLYTSRRQKFEVPHCLCSCRQTSCWQVSDGILAQKKKILFLSWLNFGRTSYGWNCRSDSVPNGRSSVSERRVLSAELGIVCARIRVAEVIFTPPSILRFFICLLICFFAFF